MKTRAITQSLAAAALLSCSPVWSQQLEDPGFYAGFGIEILDAQISGDDNGVPFDIDTRPLMLFLRGGYHVFDWLALEAHAGTGIHDDPNDGDVGNELDVRNGETELKYLYGGAIKPQWRVNFNEEVGRTFTFYALAGVAQYEFEGNAQNRRNPPAVSVSYSLDDTTEYYGAGIQIDGGISSLVLQYIQYDSSDEVDFQGFQLSFNRYFE